MSSPWNHVLCAECYSVEEPGRTPVRVPVEDVSRTLCCRCGKPTSDGIYYRKTPNAYACKGGHDPQGEAS